MVISHESQKTSDLWDICGCWPLFDSFDFALISGSSLGRDHVPQVGNLPSEYLTFGRLELESSLPVYRGQLLSSPGGWLDPWRRWLCHLGRWCTNGDWGPQDKSPSASEKQQGCWWVQKASFHTHRSPMAPLWIPSMVYFPHASQLASIPNSGQGKRTIESLGSYKVFCQYGVVSMHTWWSSCSASWGQYRTSGCHPFSGPELLC